MMRRFAGALIAVALGGPLAAQASLVGYVRDEGSLRALPGAEVSVEGIDRRTRTDKDGKYALRDLPSGTLRIHVRLVGFAPVDTSLEFTDKARESVFFLGKPPVVLDSVRVNANLTRLRGAGRESFAARRSLGFGKFIDSTALRQAEHRRLPDMLAEMPGLHIVTPPTCKLARPTMCSKRVAVTTRSQAGVDCAIQVVLDGVIVSRGVMIAFDSRGVSASKGGYAPGEREWEATFDLTSISVSGLWGVEYYRSASEAPDVYGGASEGCGVLVLWTRR